MFCINNKQIIFFNMFFVGALFNALQLTSKFDSEKTNMKQTESILKHSQEPTPPFSYSIEDVTYNNDNAGIILAGTLTKPKGAGPFSAVILIAGMGGTDRNGMMYGHKLYWVIADYLTQQGIAVLRFDKRGIGKSSGEFGMHVTSRDLAEDVRAGIDYLKTRSDIDKNRIGLVGHSEGGYIASLLATQSADIHFVVLMAGAITSNPEIVAAQMAVQLKADGASQALIDITHKVTEQILNIVRREVNIEQAERSLNAFVNDFLQDLPQELKKESNKYHFAINGNNANMKIKVFNSPWYRWFLSQDIPTVLSNLHVPVLAMYGEHDFMAPGLMLPIIEQSMKNADNQDYTLIAIPGVNHSFQTCHTGSLAEYAIITETIAPAVLKIIGDWIIVHTK